MFIAGINFSLGELELMGDFFRYLKEEGYGFHCIDERLEGDEEHLDDESYQFLLADESIEEPQQSIRNTFFKSLILLY